MQSRNGGNFSFDQIEKLEFTSNSKNLNIEFNQYGK